MCRVSVTEIDFTFNELELLRKMSINSQPWYCLSSIHSKFSNLFSVFNNFKRIYGKMFSCCDFFLISGMELANNFWVRTFYQIWNFSTLCWLSNYRCCGYCCRSYLDVVFCTICLCCNCWLLLLKLILMLLFLLLSVVTVDCYCWSWYCCCCSYCWVL